MIVGQEKEDGEKAVGLKTAVANERETANNSKQINVKKVGSGKVSA